MKKQLALLGALFLACGVGAPVSNAAPAPQVVAQATSIVTGTVTDEKGEPIIGASVSEIGTTRGTVTDIDGKYSLKVGPGAKLPTGQAREGVDFAAALELIHGHADAQLHARVGSRSNA